MTTVVYKDGVFAADTLQCMDNTRFNNVNKLFETGKYVVGTCGVASLKEEFLKFLEGNDFDKECFTKIEITDFRAIVVDKETREVFLYDALLKRIQIFTDFISIGSGQDFARGALAAGKTPKEAVEIASRFDPFTGSEVQEIILENV